jgi:hypothetical protein
MFADDMTLYHQGSDIHALISKFTCEISALQEGCEFDRIDIKWSKKFAMFITDKNVKPPNVLLLNGSIVEVVSSFKLLGVTLGNKLKVNKFTAEVRNKIGLRNNQ